jgi:hypothetical protein
LISLLDSEAFILLSKLDEKLLSLISSEVLDLVVSECHDPKYFDANQFVEKVGGLSVVAADPLWLQEVNRYRSPSLSFHDVFNLHYANSYKRILVTDSKCLNFACVSNQIKTMSFHDLLRVNLPVISKCSVI